MAHRPAPLADLRILAVEQFGAGPWATLQLADLGADVVKIEDPSVGGDVGRYVPPYQQGPNSLYFETFNRNKRSVQLDLRSDQGRGVLRDMARKADAVFSNLRGDTCVALGLTYSTLRAVNPMIVCCSLSGYGLDGPRSDEGAYDHVIQALAGWMQLTGGPHDPPTRSGLPLVDLSAGYVAAVALLAGIHRARRDGKGCDCDVSLFETGLSLLAYIGTWVASRGFVPDRRADSAHASIVPFQLFRASDGWLAVACPKESLWHALCDAIGRRDLRMDKRFVDFAGRDLHRAELVAELQSEFRRCSTDHWVELLRSRRVPVGQVNDVEGALADPQAVARGAVVEIEHPDLGTVRQVASPLRLSEHEPPLRRAPFLGEDTEAVLRELCGYSPQGVAELRAAGALGAVHDERPSAATGGGR